MLFATITFVATFLIVGIWTELVAPIDGKRIS